MKVLIANRGEIARRIGQTAKRLGIPSVCLCDRFAPPEFLKRAVDQIIFVEKEDPSLYLNGQKMVDYALEAGSTAIHPGFGFLSENADFATLVEANNLTWIGPPPKAIGLMASKAQAREIAENAGVPCTQALTHLDLVQEGTRERIREFGLKATYPLLVKAAFGGGGKGMRLVHNKDHLIEACERAYSEAKSSFGNGSLIIETYISQARHVEVQVFGDKTGRVYTLGDRDCSIQRRHQKIIEEAPALFLKNPALRAQIHRCARTLAEKVGYYSAGTVEFLVSKEEDRFYFLEMNTRLQVEHPVTEAIFGLDLVEWQFRVAQGEALPQEWADLKPRGHAIEARLYGESPEKDFLPAPYPVKAFFPFQGDGIRWEIGIDPMDDISPSFDPMFAKAIGMGATRECATQNLLLALGGTFFVGGEHNIDYLRGILRHPAFVAYDLDTHFINRLHGELLQPPIPPPVSPPPFPKVLSLSQRAFLPSSTPKTYPFVEQYSLSSPTIKNTLFEIPTEDGPWQCLLQEEFYEKTLFYLFGGFCFKIPLVPPKPLFIDPSAINHKNLTAPVPGKIVSILKKKGDLVEKEETILVLESMKMEFQIKATRSGMIEEISVVCSDQVRSGQALLTIGAL
jgi:acetyl/propionyl-CoA carboxylase alpha subunit